MEAVPQKKLDIWSKMSPYETSVSSSEKETCSGEKYQLDSLKYDSIGKTYQSCCLRGGIFRSVQKLRASKP